jgi:hypothetical protein
MVCRLRRNTKLLSGCRYFSIIFTRGLAIPQRFSRTQHGFARGRSAGGFKHGARQ